MKDRFRIFNLLLILVSLLFVIGCSSGADDDETPGSDVDTQGAASLSIGVTGSSVKSDDSNSVTVTATALDSNNAAIEGVTIRFTADRGALSAASAVTDASGAAEVSFHSGVVDQSNGTATITASLGDLTAMVPVLITGTTLTVNQESTTLSSVSSTSNLEVFVTDAGGDGIYNAEVSIEIDSSSTGSVSWSSSSNFTGVDGTQDYTITGVSSGTVVLNVRAANATATCEYTVETTGNILQITEPVSTQPTLAIGASLTVTVSDPDRGQVVISTTLGTLNGSGSAVTLDASATGTVSATLTTDRAGVATIEAFNTSNTDVKDSITVTMYSPASNASNITIQASSTVVGLSSAELTSSVEISARVTDASGNPVGDAPVAFSMANTTGGGEKISPSIVFSNDGSNADEEIGVATTTFTSGSISSDKDGVEVTAELLANPNINDSISIIIGGTSGSVVIGVSTTTLSINEDTAYDVGVSVLVADANGTPIPGATVTINLWPKGYYIGHAWNPSDPEYPRIGAFLNEDTNRNLELDAGEDLNGDGELTPANSSAGNMPGVIEVDENGVGTFSWIYLKQYAGYIKAEIKASTLVLGSETTSTLNAELKALLKPDIEDGLLGPSPFTPPTTFDRDTYESLPDEAAQDAYWSFPDWS
jgi:protocatechuate 3,4-dioxygenase beta subunit